MKPTEPRGKEELDALLDEAEALLNKDIDKDIDELQKRSHNPRINYDKYEKAKVLFEKALEIDPGDPRANDGMNACMQMLQPYYPVQYMAPIDDNLKVDLTPVVDAGSRDQATVGEREKKKPWEILADYRARDREGIKYTEKAFGEAKEKARKEILALVARAKQRLESGEKDLALIYEEAKKEIEDMQERVHRGWKGHGPEIREFAIEKLKEALGI